MSVFAGPADWWTDGTNAGRTHIATKGIVQSGLVLNLDAGVSSSYPGTGTTWTDLSGNSNIGTLTNGPIYNSDNSGSIVFDGIDDRVDIADNSIIRLSGISQATISAWFKINGGLNATRTIFCVAASNVNKIAINLSTTNNLRLGVRSVSTEPQQLKDTTRTFTSNDWVFASGVVDLSAQTVKIYVNGLEETSTGTITFTQSTFSNEAATRNTIGCQASLINFFTGSVSQASLYNRALSAAEIQQNFNAMRNRFGI